MVKKYPVSWEWIYHVFLINMFIPAKEWMWWNSVNYFWTMPAFMGWYLLAPILLKFLKTARWWAFGTLFTVVSTPLLKQWMNTIANRQFVNWNFLCLLYIFCFGCLAWFVVRERRYKEGLVYGFSIGLIGWIAGNTSGFLVFGVGFYTLILLFKILKIQFDNKKVRIVISLLSTPTYAIYLTHYFVLLFWKSDYLPYMPWFISYILFLMASWGVGILFQRVTRWTGRLKLIK